MNDIIPISSSPMKCQVCSWLAGLLLVFWCMKVVKMLINPNIKWLCARTVFTYTRRRLYANAALEISMLV